MPAADELSIKLFGATRRRLILLAAANQFNRNVQLVLRAGALDTWKSPAEVNAALTELAYEHNDLF